MIYDDAHESTWVRDAGVGPAKQAWLDEGEPRPDRDHWPEPWDLAAETDPWGGRRG